jgi:DnaJ domain
MFERTKVDNLTKVPVPCELVLDDGRELIGHILALHPRGLIDELNAPGGFAEFEAIDRTRAFLAKSSIRSARSAATAKIERLDHRIREGVPFDPHAVLGVPKTADRESIRRAYHALAKAYHPDRLQAIELPQEIVDYATAMAKRINAAYSALTGAGASMKAGTGPKPDQTARAAS